MNNLPPNWSWVKLGDAVKFIRGVSFPKDAKSFSFTKGKAACLRTANVQKAVDWDDLWFIDEKIVKREEQYVRIGDILISSANSLELLGKVSLIKHIPYKSTLGTFIVNIRVPESQEYKFIYYYLTSREFTDEVQKNASTTTNISNISVGKLEQIKIRLAPLPEQKKIVEKIEELFSGLDSGVASLKKAKEQLRIYRQSVLAYAFSGKLTGEVKGETKNGELPDGWKWVKVADVGEIVTGTTPSKKVTEYYGKDFPLYKPTDLNAGINTRNAYDNISKLGITKARLLPERSVLVTCIGATIGKTGLNKIPGATNQQINAIIPNMNFVPEFVYYFCLSEFFQKQIKEHASSTTLPILNKTKFEQLPFITAPLEQQQLIVSEIEKRFSEADNLEKAIDESLTKAETLRQSILKQAFEGKLV